ncbi:hypothetical protein GCM10011588_66840 [Nocardia jinanensis]|uniref:Uncharacterized protein n=1 Tax=Nocardia jinanensis TaxID=382504 RepID=A0A917VXT1_9NOCA|nr:hypothetical protein GCM10011588_66840 [Nocardia jinanensis]
MERADHIRIRPTVRFLPATGKFCSLFDAPTIRLRETAGETGGQRTRGAAGPLSSLSVAAVKLV